MNKMMLLTKEILEQFRKIGRQDGNDPVVVCKFFYPCGSWTWYATEYDPDDKIFFGFVVGHEGEWGSFSLDELESFTGKFGLGIERDRGFTPGKFSEVKIREPYLRAWAC